MDPSSSLDLISKDKIHHFFAFLPLLTMILLRFNVWILIVYTFFLAIFEVYFIVLSSFNKLVAKDTINLYGKDKKLKFSLAWRYLKEKFWFIDNLILLAMAGGIIIIFYFISFIYSAINLDVDYMNLILLAHIFLGSFMWRLTKAIKHLAIDKRVQEAFKNAK